MDAVPVPGEVLAVPERVIVAPAVGVFRPLGETDVDLTEAGTAIPGDTPVPPGFIAAGQYGWSSPTAISAIVGGVAVWRAMQPETGSGDARVLATFVVLVFALSLLARGVG